MKIVRQVIRTDTHNKSRVICLGGDPAPGSPRATLLRLRPSRVSHRGGRPPKVRQTTSGATHSHDVTGGVYKARERIHRDILIPDY